MRRTFTSSETFAWATRRGAAWPGSVLAGHQITVEVEDSNGDLIDYIGPDLDVSGVEELLAFLGDMIPVLKRVGHEL